MQWSDYSSSMVKYILHSHWPEFLDSPETQVNYCRLGPSAEQTAKYWHHHRRLVCSNCPYLQQLAINKVNAYCKRRNFPVGVIFAMVRISWKLLPRENNILYILLWKLHWYCIINTHVQCQSFPFLQNFPPAKITMFTLYQLFHILRSKTTSLLFNIQSYDERIWLEWSSWNSLINEVQKLVTYRNEKCWQYTS